MCFSPDLDAESYKLYTASPSSPMAALSETNVVKKTIFDYILE